MAKTGFAGRDNLSAPSGLAAGNTARQGFGTQEMEVHDSRAEGLSERAKATMQAMFVMAERNPRNWNNVRVKLLAHAERFGFADAAIWEMPRGGKTLSGESIRLIESAIQAMGHIYTSINVSRETTDERFVEIVVIDCENNIHFSREVVIPKLIERKKLAEGQAAVSQRTNSTGGITFLVEASRDEVDQMQAVQASKVIRSEGKRLLPGDILEEVMIKCEQTVAAGLKADPAAAKKKLIDSWAKLGVLPDELEKYLGHSIAQVSELELKELRGAYQAVSQGHVTWATMLKEKLGGGGPAAVSAPPVANPFPAGSQAARAHGGPQAPTPGADGQPPASPVPPQVPGLAPVDPGPDIPEPQSVAPPLPPPPPPAPPEPAYPPPPEVKTEGYNAWVIERYKTALTSAALRKLSSLGDGGKLFSPTAKYVGQVYLETLKALKGAGK